MGAIQFGDDIETLMIKNHWKVVFSRVWADVTRDLELAQLEEFSVIKTFSVSVIQTNQTRP